MGVCYWRWREGNGLAGMDIIDVLINQIAEDGGWLEELEHANKMRKTCQHDS